MRKPLLFVQGKPAQHFGGGRKVSLPCRLSLDPDPASSGRFPLPRLPCPRSPPLAPAPNTSSPPPAARTQVTKEGTELWQRREELAGSGPLSKTLRSWESGRPGLSLLGRQVLAMSRVSAPPRQPWDRMPPLCAPKAWVALNDNPTFPLLSRGGQADPTWRRPLPIPSGPPHPRPAPLLCTGAKSLFPHKEPCAGPLGRHLPPPLQTHFLQPPQLGSRTGLLLAWVVQAQASGAAPAGLSGFPSGARI